MKSDQWNQRYASQAYLFGEAPNGFLAAMASHIPAGPILCLAEGEGRNAVHLATLGHQVTAVDQSEVGLDKAQRLAEKHGVKIDTIIADLAHFKVKPDCWSGIISIFAHLPQPLRASIHTESVNGLKPGGVFILEAYTPAQLALGTGGPKTADLLMDVESLRKELTGLELIIARELEREVVEGSAHKGRSAVVQILARKH